MSRHFLVDEATQRLTFTDQRFYLHKPSFQWFASSTTILECYPKTEQFFKWLKENGENADVIRDEAGDNGSIVHHLTELYDNGQDVTCLSENGQVLYSSKAWSMFERYVEFSERYNPEVLQMEQVMVSPKLGFGGTLDRIYNFEGKKLLVDIKTSNSLYNHYWLQLASYVKLYEAETGDKLDGVAILWLNAKTRTDGKKGSYQGKGWQLCFPDRELEHYWKLFRCVHALFLEENGDMKPRNLTYKLSHKKKTAA